MAKTKKAAEPKSEKKSVDTFSFELKVNDITFETKSSDLKSALVEFIKSPLFPVGVKTRVFIKYGFGKKVVTKTIPVFMARKVFSILAHKDSAVDIFVSKLTAKLNEPGS